MLITHIVLGNGHCILPQHHALSCVVTPSLIGNSANFLILESAGINLSNHNCAVCIYFCVHSTACMQGWHPRWTHAIGYV